MSLDRFWSKVWKGDGCWVWTGATGDNGHGRISVEGKLQYAHRVAWRMSNGPIPDGFCVLHKCDNPLCVNPAHLYLGDRARNARDMVERGRSVRGERHHWSKIDDHDVRMIRMLLAFGIPTRSVAGRYEMSISNIHEIKKYMIWSHVK